MIAQSRDLQVFKFRFKKAGFTTLLLLYILVQSGCATMSNRTKTLILMGSAALVAGTVGVITSPSSERPEGHALMWGGTAAATTGVAGMFLFDEQAKATELDRELRVARKEIDALKLGAGPGEERLIYEAGSLGGNELPEDVRKLLSPGWVRVYQMSNWVKQGEDSLVHQDKVIRIRRPELLPKLESSFSEGEKK